MKFALNPSPLHWVEQGNCRNPRIVFLHGFMGSSRDWHGIMASLSAQYHCLAVDLPGHGNSLGLAPTQYAMAGSSRLIIEALAQTDSPNAPLADLIVGYSMGGRLALYLSLRFPQSFPQAQIISGSPGLATEKDREARRAIDLIRCENIKTNLKVFLRFWYQQPLFTSLWKTSLLETLMEQRLSNNPDELCRSLQYLGLGTQPNLWQELTSTEAKLHQIVGELDPKFVSITREMARVCPGLNWKVWPGVGHNIPLENPSAVISEIHDLLRTPK